ncbi:hypothetical protein [Jannaschia pohangensis]|uniref:Uncharacterized protein n=1 Tax=Jannaschia pohangensis TaxID=390807 RepID=A0A1I3IC60_9RHOB|nr:hypothetical protein [Jannaschia pohangensis]SFI45343.1 hypothetical protein SAMN04488095_0897 [Jannaschia pohangensis]
MPGEIAQAAGEALLALFARPIYGSDDAPKPQIRRNILRVIGFGGVAVMALWLLDLTPFDALPMFPTGLWILAFLIVLFAEFELGNWRVGIAAWLAAGTLVAIWWVT